MAADLTIDLGTDPVDDPRTVTERRWRAMGSDAHVIVVGAPAGLAELAVARVEELEARWSRFRPDSEISRLNAAAGRPVAVSPATTLLVERAVEAWRFTGGGYDPTVLGAVERAGYDRSFERLVPSDRPRLPAPVSLVACTDIEVGDGTVTLPAGTGFDPGGIGKGLAADLVLAELMSAGALGACVNLGGDLRVAGVPDTGSAWTVSIDHPRADAPVTVIGLVAGAVATSTTLLRRWSDGLGEYHHLIDPVTGEPSTTDLEFATVVAGEAWEAEVLAKAVVLRGADRAFDLLVADRHHALTVDRDGVVRTSPGFAAFVGATAPPARLPRHRPLPEGIPS